MQTSEILRIIDAKRESHPELDRPLTWPAVQRILARERVRLYVQTLPNPARLIRFGQRFAIAINSDAPVRRHTYFAAHELGHLWLHVQNEPDTGVVCFHMDREWHADPREDDAEYFATVLLNGRIPEPEEAAWRRQAVHVTPAPSADLAEEALVLPPEPAGGTWPRPITAKQYDLLTDRILLACSPEELGLLETNIKEHFVGVYVRDLMDWIEDRMRDLTGGTR
jgi:hypothetical protein